MKHKIKLQKIKLERWPFSMDAKQGEYLFLSVDKDFPSEFGYDLGTFYNGWVNTGSHGLEEDDICAYAYLGSQ